MLRLAMITAFLMVSFTLSGHALAQSFDEVQKKAQGGDAEAQYNLGVMYYNGSGVTKDHKQAAKWYKEAADQGLAKAQVNLGELCRYGLGAPRSYVTAVEWYEKAANQGHLPGMYHLGWMYYYGMGASNKEAQGIALFEKAAAQGHRASQYMLIDIIWETAEGELRSTEWAETKRGWEEMDQIHKVILELRRSGEKVQDKSEAVAKIRKRLEEKKTAERRKDGGRGQ